MAGLLRLARCHGGRGQPPAVGFQAPGGAGWRFLAHLWPWPLLLMATWLPGSWLMGHLFSDAMLAVSGLTFVVFDIGLPVLATVSGFGREKRSGAG